MELRDLIGQILKSRLEPGEENNHFKLVSSVTGHQTVDFNRNIFEKWCRNIERKLTHPNLGNLEKDFEMVSLCPSFLGSKRFTLLLEAIVKGMTGLPRSPERDEFLMDIGRCFLKFYRSSNISHLDLDEDDASRIERLHFEICGCLFERYPEVIETEVPGLIQLPSAPDHSPVQGVGRLVFGICSSSGFVCQRVWNIMRTMHPTASALLEVFMTRVQLTRPVLTSMYSEQLSILVWDLLENPLGLPCIACQHCLHKAMQRLADQDLSNISSESLFWLPLEFPAWAITAPIMCFLAERQFLRSSIQLWRLMSPTARTRSMEEIESVVVNLRCLSEKTSLNFDELKFSLVCHRFGQKRSFEESDDEFTLGPPGKKRIIHNLSDGTYASVEVGAFLGRTDPRPFSTQPVLAPPSSIGSRATCTDTSSELVEELLCYFVLSQSADKVLMTLELISKLPGFRNKERYFPEKLSTIFETMSRLRPKWDVDWVDHVVSNVVHSSSRRRSF